VHRASRAQVAALLACGAAMATCNPFPSYDGLTGGIDGGIDSASPNDAGADAAVGPCTDGLTCPAGAIFCDAFERDDAQDVQGTWSSVSLSAGSTLAIVAGTPTCHALQAHVPAGTAGAMAALVNDPKVVISQQVTMRSAMLLGATPTMGAFNANEVSFQYQDADGGYVTSSIFPLINGPGILIAEVKCAASCNYDQSTTSLPFAPGQWHQLSFTVDFQTTPATLTLTVDGNMPLKMQSAVDVRPGTLEFEGAAAVVDAPNSEVLLTIDDVVVTGS
jgi:hypothetical protein